MQIKQTLNTATHKLTKVTATPQFEAEILLAHLLKCDRSYLYTQSLIDISEQTVNRYNELIEQRMQDKPLAYLTKHKEFWTLDLEINEHVLIPRPETELLVDIVLQKFSKNKTLKLADLGTGSGAIALAIAKERPYWQIIATDTSPKALEVAQINAKKHNINNVEFIQNDWGNLTLPNTDFDIIASNPPYIANTDPHLETSIRYEPNLALVSGPDGLNAIRLIIAQATQYLASNGMLILEHGYNQGEQVKTIMQHQGYINIEQHFDLAGNIRVTLGYMETMQIDYL